MMINLLKTNLSWNQLDTRTKINKTGYNKKKQYKKGLVWSLNNSFTIWARWILALSSSNFLKEKKWIDKISCSFRWQSADFISLPHNVAKPRPNKLKQPQIIVLLLVGEWPHMDNPKIHTEPVRITLDCSWYKQQLW